jgi:hypothetical protein
MCPEVFRRLIIDVRLELVGEDPRQFPIMKASVERFQPVHLLAHGLGDARRPLLAARAAANRQEPGHALLPETARQHADGIGVCLRFVCPLHGSPITKEHERANDLIAPLDGIDKPQA